MRNTKAIQRNRIGLLFMFISFVLSIVVALITGSLPLPRNIPPDTSAEDFQVHLSRRVPSLMTLFRIPGCSIALVHNSEIVWTEAYGIADLESETALTVDTPMRVQSISKSVTAWGILKLAEQGMIDLDDPVSKYLTSWHLPESDFASYTITIRQLMSHTAGLPLGDVFTTYAPDDDMPSLEQKLTQEAKLVRKPGLRFSYSNTGYNLLELLIEQVTARDFSDYMLTEVLLPLGMNSSSFDWSRNMKPSPPTGYDIRGKSVPVYVYPEKASGGLFATAADIARFATAGSCDNPVLKTDNVETLYKPISDKIGIYGLVFDAYGLGHYIETVPNGLRSVSHGGQGSGIMTHFQSVPETGDAIVILTNSQRSWPFISYLLRDWARWLELPSVGMEKIIWGRYALSILVGMLLSAAFLMIRRTLLYLFRKRTETEKSERLKSHCRLIQWLQRSVSLILMGALLWGVCQKYLFITSIFPILSVWLGAAIMLLSVSMFIFALIPCEKTCM